MNATEIENWLNTMLDHPGQLPHMVLSFSLKLLVVVCISLLLMRVLHLLSGHLKNWMIRSHLVSPDNDKRIQTLIAIVYSIACWLIAVLAVLVVLNEAGINIAPFLVGASVFGAAVAFGTQSLVKDLIYGFFIIAENQFAIGDWVQAAGVTGQVKEMSFRRVILRDEQGRTHILPNGEITKVTRLGAGPEGFDIVTLELSFQQVAYPKVVALLTAASTTLQDQPEAILLDPLGVSQVKEWESRLVRVSITAKVAKGMQWVLFQQLRDVVNRQLTEDVLPEAPSGSLVTMTLRGESAPALPVAQ